VKGDKYRLKKPFHALTKDDIRLGAEQGSGVADIPSIHVLVERWYEKQGPRRLRSMKQLHSTEG
jgi:hypothetical protein